MMRQTQYISNLNELTTNFQKDKSDLKSANIDKRKTCMLAKANYPPFLPHRPPAHMYVYTDIIKSNFVRDVLASLLRIIKMKQNT